MNNPRAGLLLLCLLGACVRAPLAPRPDTADEAALRAWMDHQLGSIDRATLSARVHLDGALGQGQIQVDGDWQQGRGLRLILRTPLGTELARLDTAAGGLSLREERLEPLLGQLENTPVGALLAGAAGSTALDRTVVGRLLWGDLRPGPDARLGRDPQGRPAFESGDTLWTLDPASALCTRMEYPGTRIELERLHRRGPWWQPRLLRLVQRPPEGGPAQAVVIEYRELELGRP